MEEDSSRSEDTGRGSDGAAGLDRPRADSARSGTAPEKVTRSALSGVGDSLGGTLDRLPRTGLPIRVLVTAVPVTVLEAVLFVGPLLVILGLSVIRMVEFNLVYEFTVENYVAVVASTINRRAWANTLLVSAVVTVVTVGLAYPLAYYIARSSRRRRTPLLFLVMIPFWVNYVIRLYGWRLLLAERGVINAVLGWTGLVSEPVPWLVGSTFAVVVGQVSLVLPFAVLPLYVSLEAIDRSLIEAAADLGASRLQILRRVVFPLSIAGLAVALMLLVVFNMGMFMAPRLLGKGLYIGARIDAEFGTINWPAGAALAVVLMLVVLTLLWVLVRPLDIEAVLGRRGLGAGGDVGGADRPGGGRAGRVLSLSAGLVYAFLYLPLASIILFSFEDGQFPGLPWDGFTVEWYGRFLESAMGMAAVGNSLIVAAAVTALATGIGSLAAVALVRFDFRAKRAFWALVVAPLTVPWLVLGISLLFMFSTIGVIPHLHTVVGGQLVFVVPVVAFTVGARLRGIDRALEEAARDLGAGDWAVYRRVTVPLLMPGVVSGALFAFGLSFNDFLIAFFTSGIKTTFPIWLFATLSRGTVYVTYAASALTITASVVFVALVAIVWNRLT